MKVKIEISIITFFYILIKKKILFLILNRDIYMKSMKQVSIIGVGFVGGAMVKSLSLKNVPTKSYDKFKDLDSFESCLDSSIMFLCLPTLFSEEKMEYDKSAIHETCQMLEKHQYDGIVVIKSTVEPMTTISLATTYPSLKFIHNPEFLTARTAFEDFHNQTHIVLGTTSTITDSDLDFVKEFYHSLYPVAEISICSSTESESMKIFCNTFYAVKIHFFTELHILCKKMNCDYDTVKQLMLKNNWINPMHTTIPGPDGMLSYGGYCFPKDTNALCKFMESMQVPHALLENTIEERNDMRPEKFF